MKKVENKKWENGEAEEDIEEENPEDIEEETPEDMMQELEDQEDLVAVEAVDIAQN